MTDLKLKEIMWEEIDQDLWKNNPKEAERREYYLPFYRSLEKRLIDRINEMLPTIKEAAEFAKSLPPTFRAKIKEKIPQMAKIDELFKKILGL